jgi:hypothetical protein
MPMRVWRSVEAVAWRGGGGGAWWWWWQGLCIDSGPTEWLLPAGRPLRAGWLPALTRILIGSQFLISSI